MNGGECQSCQKEKTSQTLQRSAINNETPNEVPGIVHDVLASPGKPLDNKSRAFFEPRFDHDFSQVRIHSDTKAAESASSVSAAAYTVGQDIVFGSGRFDPESSSGRHLLAHELAHTTQQADTSPTNVSRIGEPNDAHEVQSEHVATQVLASGKAQLAEPSTDKKDFLRRVPAAPQGSTGTAAPFDRSKVDLPAVPDMVASPGGPKGFQLTPQTATATFNDPNITHLVWELYDPTDNMVDGFGTMAGDKDATTTPFIIQNTDPHRPQWKVVQGRHILRCVGYSTANEPIAYADRSFYIWTTTPTGKPPDIAALEAEKKQHEATTKAGSGKSFGEVGSAFAKLKDVTHDLSVLETGTGTYVGTRCAVKPAGAVVTDCTSIVLEVLENTFAQQGRSADWDKVKKKYAANITARGDTKLSGLDVQAALQSEAGWKGIYWAPDPAYLIPKAELDKANPDEASFAYGLVKDKGTYYKDFGKKGYPGLTVSQSVVNYAPEQPKAGTASTTTKDTTQLNKLKKLPFGVLAAHGGEHMTIITYGKVIEVHWRKEATSADVIEQTDLESWAVGARSGYHYYASGAIVAPASDVDAAFK
ncbi:MAG TPA: DUF4157 domain-containing protein [Terriglobales bacterium]|nr:DUF4157 domain-containing protein [Terriglobales bacterium]